MAAAESKASAIPPRTTRLSEEAGPMPEVCGARVLRTPRGRVLASLGAPASSRPALIRSPGTDSAPPALSEPQMAAPRKALSPWRHPVAGIFPFLRGVRGVRRGVLFLEFAVPSRNETAVGGSHGVGEPLEGASMKRGNLVPRRARKSRRSARFLLLRIESA